VEDQETLKTGALVCELSDSVEDKVNNFLTDGVVTTGVVVGSIFLAGDELFWVEQLTVGASSDFVDDGWLEVNKDASWDVFASTSLGEEGVERVVTATDGLIGWHLTVWCNTVLEAVKFPAGVTYLDASLANVDGDHFSHDEGVSFLGVVELEQKKVRGGCFGFLLFAV